ncbi:MAG: MBL fold metallo-hydrolase [Thermoguttaceae bacterium]|nr:MBL fold metallo-hydrolase [Thermoguttaceae bacterium]
MLTITAAVNDQAREGVEGEHGLSLILRRGRWLALVDLGAGRTTAQNLARFGVDFAEVDDVFFSHGHYDHTGGLAPLAGRLKKARFWHGPDFTRRRWRVEQDLTRQIGMPEPCRAAWDALAPERLREVGAPMTHPFGGGEILLTGPIPRRSTETPGGPFFLDSCGTRPDTIDDEIALAIPLRGGGALLITGCCHAGLINTLEHCRSLGLTITAVFGGLHLNRAGGERLRRTADYLNGSPVERLILTHCTGAEAGAFLAREFRGETFAALAGDTLEF